MKKMVSEEEHLKLKQKLASLEKQVVELNEKSIQNKSEKELALDEYFDSFRDDLSRVSSGIINKSSSKNVPLNHIKDFQRLAEKCIVKNDEDLISNCFRFLVGAMGGSVCAVVILVLSGLFASFTGIGTNIILRLDSFALLPVAMCAGGTFVIIRKYNLLYAETLFNLERAGILKYVNCNRFSRKITLRCENSVQKFLDNGDTKLLLEYSELKDNI